MGHLKFITVATSLTLCLSGASSCNNKTESKKQDPVVQTTLYDKTLPEIKGLINGKWELVSGQNARELCEFENTFIEFNDDEYTWIEDGKKEPGKLNWRQAGTNAGYDAYQMDVFYETSPSYPLSISGDTLFIQDCTETAYKYTLVRQ